MTDAMIHRGPSDRGTYSADGIALGARRLSIVDVAGGHQPVSNENGTIWAVQNGELYNHEDLRRQLAADGHTFRSDCDTDILPHLYEYAGTAFAERLRGKFAIAVWDEPGVAPSSPAIGSESSRCTTPAAGICSSSRPS